MSRSNNERGYMGAREGEPCLTYAEFCANYGRRPELRNTRIRRYRWKYYVLSWRALNPAIPKNHTIC